MVNKLSKNEIVVLRQSGQILSNALKTVARAVKPGMPTMSLEEIAETELRRQGGQPSFKNYSNGDELPYPNALCVSINDEVVHAMPTKNKVIKEGDLVSLDLGCVYKGMFTDMAMTVAAGKISKIEQKLIDVTRKSLSLGISQARAGGFSGDIGQAIQGYVEKNGFKVVRDLVGHGVGHDVHEEPPIPNFGTKGTGVKLEVGMGLAIEPMVNLGKSEIYVGPDKWTVLTRDGRKSAHFEQTIVVSSGDPTIITPL